ARTAGADAAARVRCGPGTVVMRRGRLRDDGRGERASAPERRTCGWRDVAPGRARHRPATGRSVAARVGWGVTGHGAISPWGRPHRGGARPAGEPPPRPLHAVRGGTALPPEQGDRART